ncbi:STAS/SEC14 domain-containing protein [Pikeienuella piscinae]|uniref:STAS/SEC14 domain-containing protein n=1 Tax=Pikeienuella piscinae TaxID=2748098 RepID=A0A7L5C1L6_9RHOB|nr:STAS/SEC14 domain-containing protein [Pikeienuella piscinae]QIE55749.1 STAS/SEC14 domain-containing protein [Pikeienuella piscinae]
MLKIDFDAAHNCFRLEPSGRLTEADFTALTSEFNAKVNETDNIPNLVIHAATFPGWADFAGFVKHFDFLRDHHRMIDRVALVSDSRILDIAPRIARHLVWAEIRHFPGDELDAALAWVAERKTAPENVTVIEGLPPAVLGISVRGVIGARDYAERIVPLVEEKLAAHKRIRLLYHIGPEFESMTPGAVWSDARVGAMHLNQFSKIAVVSDLDWIRHATRIFAPLVSGQVHVFGDRELEAAKAWISADADGDEDDN